MILPITGFGQNDTINRLDGEGRKQGYWIFLGKDRPDSGYPENGKIEEGKYINGRKEGKWTKYYADGMTVKISGEYKNNRPEGRYVKYYEDGSIQEIGSFSKGSTNWPRRRYNRDGSIEFSSSLLDSAVVDSTFNYFSTKCIKSIDVYFSNRFYKKTLLYSDLKCNDLVRIDSARFGGPLQCTWGINEIQFIYKEADSSLNHFRNNQDHRQIVTYRLIDSLIIDDNAMIVIEQHKLFNEVKQNNNHEVHCKGSLPKLNGYNKLYNADDEVFIDGDFENGDLINGKVYIYNSEGVLIQVLVYKSGVYHSDAQR